MALPPARALIDLPPLPEDVRKWRILLLVSAVNSLTQRVATYLTDLGCERVSTELALSDDSMISATIAHSPHVIICPFLVKKVPEVIYNNIVTLIVHPGPPGDAGPAALDWVLLGDRGLDADSDLALANLQKPIDYSVPYTQRQRSHWGITVLQADNTMDGGPVWAFDQFPLPDITRTTKSSLYQGQVTSATIRAVTVALTRISKAFSGLSDPSHRASRVAVPVDPNWSLQCVSHGVPFMGGAVHDRPQIKPGQRRPNFDLHCAADVARIINCGDSQPGGTLKTARSFIFAYDAKIHLRIQDIPAALVQESGCGTWDAIPAGKAIATRDGAVLFKTAPCVHGDQCAFGCGVAVWLTHGRNPKSATSQALPAKIPMTEALRAAGEDARLDGVPEWFVHDFTEVPGTYQQVFVRSVTEGDAVIQFVYWDFYNGAFSTTGCEHLVRALQWASEPARGNVKVLALMGGAYFSNGVALNIIESAEHPGRETWANINAIDDVVEFIAGDASSVPRSDFLAGVPSLIERGITTVACLRGNAAAGGVALAAACDVVVSAGTTVLNPAYRAMGLHGSEFHLYSYVERCGRSVATHLVKDMLPLSASRARELGLVDVVLGGSDASATTSTALIMEYIRGLATAPSAALGTETYPSAPWTRPVPGLSTQSSAISLVERICENKRARYESASHVPLVNYRHEELSQMLLDSFHPARSLRYHTRRIKFVRKVKAEGTPTRFVQHRLQDDVDEEEQAEFDAAPGWVRGEEWSWVGLQTPSSMATSQGLLIDFGAPVPPLATRRPSSSSGSEPSADIRTDMGNDTVPPSPAVAQSSTPYLAPDNSFAKHLPRETHRDAKSAVYINEPLPKERPATINRVNGVSGSSKAYHGETLDMHAAKFGSRSSTNLSSPSPSKRRGASFLGKLAGAFRSRSDLRTENLRSPSSPLSPSSRKESPSALNMNFDEAPRASTGHSTPISPAYNRPHVANEGNTESPCLFNITGDMPEPHGDARPTVISA